MEDIEDFKIMWQELNQRISYLENDNKNLIRQIRETNYRNTQEKLVRKYCMFIGVEVIMIFFMSIFFLYNPLLIEKYRIPALIYWIVFFIFEALFDLFLLFRIKDIDIYSSTIKEVAARSASNWKLHKIGIGIGLPLAFGAIFLFALAVDANQYTILGMILGGIIGFIIGIYQLIKFKDYYKLLQVKD